MINGEVSIADALRGHLDDERQELAQKVCNLEERLDRHGEFLQTPRWLVAHAAEHLPPDVLQVFTDALRVHDAMVATVAVYRARVEAM